MQNSRPQPEFNFSWSGPTATPLRSTFAKPAPVVFFLKANEIRKKHKIFGPPFDPYHYADALGITVEEVAGLPMDGLLKRKDSGGFIIQLKSDVSQSRKNFTLAHELAHTFFYDHLMEKSLMFRGNNKADPVEEALCNVGARELLMPRSIFQRDLKDYRQNGLITPTTLVQLANRYRVSLHAVAIRTVTIEKKAACAMWEKPGRAVNMQWVAPKSMGRLVVCQTGQSSIELAFKGPPDTLVAANDSFYCTGRVRRRVVRRTLSQKLPNGFVFSILLPRSKSQKPLKDSEIKEVVEHWWQRY